MIYFQDKDNTVITGKPSFCQSIRNLPGELYFKNTGCHCQENIFYLLLTL